MSEEKVKLAEFSWEAFDDVVVGKRIAGILFRAMSNKVVGIILEDGTCMTGTSWEIREPEETRSLLAPMEIKPLTGH